MSHDLKARLSYIRNAGVSPVPGKRSPSPSEPSFDESSWPGWTTAGHKVLKRVIQRELFFSLPGFFSATTAILIPDLLRRGNIPPPENYLFFDLETTGLSGGAGTLAFLAAFGRFINIKSAKTQIEITQYLLLDYPGEGDFIENAVKEFEPHYGLPVVVSYNGKCFDSQIMKNRCLMNGVKVPEYSHADLLHPARRLWKGKLPDCSQATIETSILGLDRTGDVPGALAPEIWFSFLRNNNNYELLSICDHNVRDITGLASLFLAMAEIAAKPMECKDRYQIDEEAFALSWIGTVNKYPHFFGDSERTTGEFLLKSASENGCKRVVFVYATDLFKKGSYQDGRELLLKLTGEGNDTSGVLKAAAYKSLAIDAEWRQRNPSLALDYTSAALAITGMPDSQRDDLEKRRMRLEVKSGGA